MNGLLARAREGEMEAAYELYLAALPLIRSTARKFAHIDNAISMDDLTQEGFFAVLDAAGGYDERRGGWNRTLVWALKNRFRRMIPTRRRCAPGISCGPGVEQIAGGEAADEALLAVDYRRSVHTAIHAHTDTVTARILQAHDIEGISLTDVAQQLDIPYQTVCARRRSALRRLRHVPELQALFRDAGNIEALTYGRSAEDCALGVMQ